MKKNLILIGILFFEIYNGQFIIRCGSCCTYTKDFCSTDISFEEKINEILIIPPRSRTMYLVPDSNGTSSLSSPVVDTLISLTYTEAASGSNANSSCCLCIPAYKAMLILHVYLQHYHLNESKRWRKD